MYVYNILLVSHSQFTIVFSSLGEGGEKLGFVY